MHQISSIEVDNYKSIVSALFNLATYTPLVGYNNAGKTNILKALSWAVKKTSLSSGDFNDREQPVSVTCVITGIDEVVLDSVGNNHRKKIEPFIYSGELTIRRTQLEPGVSVGQVILEVRAEDGSWAKNPAGIDAAVLQLFPEPIFIGAMENATEDVGKFGASTTIGKLIKEIIAPLSARHASSVNSALEELSHQLSADGVNKDETLVEVDNKIEVELSKIFPGLSARTHIPTPEFSDFLKGATIKFFEDAHEDPNGRDASSFGHGAQRAVQIALIKCLADLKKGTADNAGRTTLLLVDEPELYLHPQAIELVRASLSRLSEEGYQVVFTTHSAAMISRIDAPYALLIRRNPAMGTFCFPRLVDAASEAIQDATHQAEILFTLTNATKILFSERIILAEGKTEQAVLPDTYLAEFGCTLDEDRNGLVALGGVSNMPNALKVLDSIGVPCKAIVDLDFVFRGAISAGYIDGDHESILGCKNTLKRLSDQTRIVIDAGGLPTGKNDICSASDAFAMMAEEEDAKPHLDTLHKILKQHKIWFWKLGAIEAHLGLASKSSAEHLNFVTQVKEVEFRNQMPDYAGTQAMLSWLRT